MFHCLYCVFQGVIIIHEVYEDGAAAKDGRLWAGDQILEVTRLRWETYLLIYEQIIDWSEGWGLVKTFPPFAIFSCDQAALWMVFSVRLSVCPSVRLSVRLSHLFDYVPIIVSSWNFQELSHWTRVRSMQKVKVRGQRSRSQRSRPKFSFPDCNSSLNSHMMMKWYI